MANKQMHHLVIDGDNYEIVDLVARQGGGGGSSITVDSELSATSTNPVQNKVIKSALDGKINTSDIEDGITGDGYSGIPVSGYAVTQYIGGYEATMVTLMRSNNLVTVSKSFLQLYYVFSLGMKAYFIMPNSQTDVVVLGVDRVDTTNGKIYLSSVVNDTLYEVELTAVDNNSMSGTVKTASLSVATTTTAGLMSATDKSNLDTLYADYLSASTALG